MRLALVLSLLLSACGYHLVGQGKSAVIPQGTTSATLLSDGSRLGKILLGELQQQWLQKASLPSLHDKNPSQNLDTRHVTLRIESPNETFIPVAFDGSGLAIQYRLSVTGVLNMYQENTLIWRSGVISSNADIFGDASALANNPTAIEAERETLVEQLRKQWAQEALARLQSGF